MSYISILLDDAKRLNSPIAKNELAKWPVNILAEYVGQLARMKLAAAMGGN